MRRVHNWSHPLHHVYRPLACIHGPDPLWLTSSQHTLVSGTSTYELVPVRLSLEGSECKHTSGKTDLNCVWSCSRKMEDNSEKGCGYSEMLLLFLPHMYVCRSGSRSMPRQQMVRAIVHEL